MAAGSKTSVWRSDLTSQPQKNSSHSTWQYRNRDRRRKSSHHKQQTRRLLPPELLTQIRAESHGRAYVQKQIRKKTPMIFELYGEHIEGVISRRLTYALAVVSVNEEVHHLEKLNIKYMYKREEMPQVVQDIEVDEGLKAQNLISIAHRSERLQIDDRVLVRCCKKKIPVRLTLRGGEIITGVIRWFSQYDMKMLLAHGGNVVVFRHGLHRFEINPQWT